MTNLISLMTAVFLLFISNGQYTSEEIKKNYRHLIQLEIFETYFDLKSASEIPDDIILSDFYRENWAMVYYLQKYHAGLSQDDLKKNLDDFDRLQEKYYTSLRNSERFNLYFLDVANRYLLRSNNAISDIVPIQRITISEEELMQIASRFFLAYYIYEEDRYVFRICAAVIEEDMPRYIPHYPIIEAFSFQAIRMADLDMPENHDFNDDFLKNIQSVQKLDLYSYEGINKGEKVKNKMYELMSKSEKLKNYLTSYFQLNADILPFEIK